MVTDLRARLTAHPSSASQARHLLCQVLGPCPATASVQDACLVLDELVTNAIRHVGEDFDVRLVLGERTLRIEVIDVCACAPIPRCAGPEATGGRGLPIVAALSDAWGVEAHAPGKAVWAEVHLTAGHPQ